MIKTKRKEIIGLFGTAIQLTVRGRMVNATVEALRKRQQQIAARIAAIASSEKAKARKEDTRLKVLVGAAILADVARHPEMRAGVLAVLQRAITADRDREFLKDKGWL